ncbi:uncharacterized protein LOC134288721 [Aedes albopictus]|uniref:Reverse transcriptase domain-containing protein n=1 Tax=Aedes albopictus TaxID=7160 RepID=A0ABM1ZG02_AEDAL
MEKRHCNQIEHTVNAAVEHDMDCNGSVNSNCDVDMRGNGLIKVNEDGSIRSQRKKTEHRIRERKEQPGTKTQHNSIVQRLRALNIIDDKKARFLKTYSAVCPRIYGQPKAHKAGLPLRPVVPNMTAPSYNLAKFVGSILQQSIESRYNIKDSFAFCHFINSVQLPVNHGLISLDVTALFTSIPKHLVITNIRQKWDKIEPHTTINQSLFVEIVEFCIDSSYFMYEAADLVMESLLDDVLEKLDFELPFLRKFVDDLITAIPLEKLQQV